jgi:molybdopterin-guanine dinucleotide biosynthesis protein B
MNRVHVVGRKNHGKTTLILDLIEELRRRGLRVGTIKHTSHAHELDAPGKDSHRHRLAGADPVAVVTPDLVGLYVSRPADDDDFYRRLAPLFADCDLVLVEGHLEADALKVEVWREALGGPCLASAAHGVAAVITDDRPEVAVPLWPRSDPGRVVDCLLALAARWFGSRPCASASP